MIKSQKVYIRDSGLLHALLRIESFDAHQAHPGVGNSWEGFVIEQIAGILPGNTPLYFYRTAASAETDLLIFDRKNQPLAVEIKYSLSPKPERGFSIAFEDLSFKKGFIVYPSPHLVLWHGILTNNFYFSEYCSKSIRLMRYDKIEHEFKFF